MCKVFFLRVRVCGFVAVGRRGAKVMRYVSCFTASRSRAAQAQPKCSEGEKKERRAEARMKVRVDGDAV